MCRPAVLRRVGKTDRTGTKTSFRPDPQIFATSSSTTTFSTAACRSWRSSISGVKIVFQDDRGRRGRDLQIDRGLVQFIEYLNRASEPLHSDIIHFSREQDGVNVEIAVQYTSEFTANEHSFVNNINTVDGGTHLSGFRSALRARSGVYGKAHNLFKDFAPAARISAKG